jgi:WD40 repeat protein
LASGSLSDVQLDSSQGLQFIPKAVKLTRTGIRSTLARMTRKGILLACGVACLLCTATSDSIRAQAAFPAPEFTLLDAKHQEPEPDVRVASDYVTQGSQVFVRVLSSPTRINAMSFSRDGSLLAAGKDYGRVAVWDVASRSFVVALDTGMGPVVTLAISPNNRLIATGGRGSEIQLWRLPDGGLVHRFPTGFPPRYLAFAPDSASLIVYEAVNNPVYVMDTSTGKHIVDFDGEHFPALSTDGTIMMTEVGSQMVLRSTSDWKEMRTLPKPIATAWPASLDPRSDTYVYADMYDEHSFVAVHLSDGTLYPNPRVIDLPRFATNKPYFASLDPKSGLVFGHSGGRLWAWNFQTGKTCVSQDLNSESGALSPDGRLVAAAIDKSGNGSDEIEPGVALWRTDSAVSACGLSEHHRPKKRGLLQRLFGRSK